MQWLKADPNWFPPSFYALDDPNGLLAVGGDLSEERLLNAYRKGIFPWYDENQPILWWSPDPRMVIYPESLHISRSLQKHLRKTDWHVTIDRSFSKVIHACAGPRKQQQGTWINEDINHAYCNLHSLGYAHSVEVWNAFGELVGGIYGVGIGEVFFGESMFSTETNASKTALVYFCRWLLNSGFKLLDCQVENPHLGSLGAINIERTKFEGALREYCSKKLEKKMQDVWANARNKMISRD